MTRKKTDWATWDETRARYPVDEKLYAKARAEIDAEITGYQLAQLRKNSASRRCSSPGSWVCPRPA